MLIKNVWIGEKRQSCKLNVLKKLFYIFFSRSNLSILSILKKYCVQVHVHVQINLSR